VYLIFDLDGTLVMHRLRVVDDSPNPLPQRIARRAALLRPGSAKILDCVPIASLGGSQAR